MSEDKAHTYNEINLSIPPPPTPQKKREYVNYLVEEIPGGRGRGFEDRQELMDFLWNFQYTPGRTLHIKYFGNEQKSGENSIQ